MINNHLLIAIDEELHLRKLVPKSTDKRLITYKRLEDMTPQERDSLLKITKPGYDQYRSSQNTEYRHKCWRNDRAATSRYGL